MQANADEPPKVLEEEDTSKDDPLPELLETNTLAMEEKDITVMEESVVVSPAPVLTTDAPEAGSKCSTNAHVNLCNHHLMLFYFNIFFLLIYIFFA